MSAGTPPLLAIVPARAGSRGVPRKNLRTLSGRPLIAHTLEAVASANVADRLVLSSDDPQALRWAELHGYEVHDRPAELASAEATISDVASAVVEEFGWTGDVGVFQPTSPLLAAESIASAVERFRESGADSLASCMRERHLFWLDEEGDLGSARPLFSERANRQVATHQVLRETGGIQLVRAEALQESGLMVTNRHELYELDGAEALDIDTSEDLMAARAALSRGTVVFRLRADRTVGAGHLHHCLQLADELADQDLYFLLVQTDDFAAEVLEQYGYPHRVERDLETDLRELAGRGPSLVVNDVLDTAVADVLSERRAGYRVVNVEDLGPGARYADWVVNALYPAGDQAAPHASWGPRYATLRAEFLDLPPKIIKPAPERVLITFGGTDPTGQAARCAALLNGEISQEIRVIMGPGSDDVSFPGGVAVLRGSVSMPHEMMQADVVVTSAGRTVYEAAITGTPLVVLAANAREATHAHIGYDAGVLFVGLGSLVSDEQIVEPTKRLLADPSLRHELSQRLRASIDGRGAARIAHRIRALLNDL